MKNGDDKNQLGFVVHAGFMTYLLGFVLFMVGLSFFAPDLFHAILDSIKELMDAFKGTPAGQLPGLR